MSDSTQVADATSQTTSASATIETASTTSSGQTSVHASPQTPVAPPAPKPGDVGTPEWLNPRLEQAKRSAREALLKDLGVDDPEVAKKALAEAKARADAEKTAAERAEAEKKRADKAEKDLETYRAALSTKADKEFATLTPAQQAFVEKTAGSDPAKRLSTIEDVRSLVATSAPSPSPQEQSVNKTAEKKPEEIKTEEQKKPLPAPASTAPGGATPPANPIPPVDHLAVLDRLDRSNPIAAGAYYAKHSREINAARAQKSRGTPASQ